MNGPYKSEQEARNVVSYIKTKFFHFLLGLRKNTQHTTKKTYKFIPIQDFSQEWTDEKLYKKYNLTKKEIDFIESMIRPME
jgi:site-specific DNA-methyltransferase (adenine-specific)